MLISDMHQCQTVLHTIEGQVHERYCIHQLEDFRDGKHKARQRLQYDVNTQPLGYTCVRALQVLTYLNIPFFE
jgi:hypothetical protein